MIKWSPLFSTIENKPAQFHKQTRKVSWFVTEEKTDVYGLENAYGHGRSLAVWILEKGCIVKDVNTALSYAQRKSVPMYRERDRYDAEALVLINKLDYNKLDKLSYASPLTSPHDFQKNYFTASVFCCSNHWLK